MIGGIIVPVILGVYAIAIAPSMIMSFLETGYKAVGYIPDLNYLSLHLGCFDMPWRASLWVKSVQLRPLYSFSNSQLNYADMIISGKKDEAFSVLELQITIYIERKKRLLWLPVGKNVNPRPIRSIKRRYSTGLLAFAQ